MNNHNEYTSLEDELRDTQEGEDDAAHVSVAPVSASPFVPGMISPSSLSALSHSGISTPLLIYMKQRAGITGEERHENDSMPAHTTDFAAPSLRSAPVAGLVAPSSLRTLTMMRTFITIMCDCVCPAFTAITCNIYYSSSTGPMHGIIAHRYQQSVYDQLRHHLSAAHAAEIASTASASADTATTPIINFQHTQLLYLLAIMIASFQLLFFAIQSSSHLLYSLSSLVLHLWTTQLSDAALSFAAPSAQSALMLYACGCIFAMVNAMVAYSSLRHCHLSHSLLSSLPPLLSSFHQIDALSKQSIISLMEQELVKRGYQLASVLPPVERIEMQQLLLQSGSKTSDEMDGSLNSHSRKQLARILTHQCERMQIVRRHMHQLRILNGIELPSSHQQQSSDVQSPSSSSLPAAITITLLKSLRSQWIEERQRFIMELDQGFSYQQRSSLQTSSSFLPQSIMAGCVTACSAFRIVFFTLWNFCCSRMHLVLNRPPHSRSTLLMHNVASSTEIGIDEYLAASVSELLQLLLVDVDQLQLLSSPSSSATPASYSSNMTHVPLSSTTTLPRSRAVLQRQLRDLNYAVRSIATRITLAVDRQNNGARIPETENHASDGGDEDVGHILEEDGNIRPSKEMGIQTENADMVTPIPSLLSSLLTNFQSSFSLPASGSSMESSAHSSSTTTSSSSSSPDASAVSVASFWTPSLSTHLHADITYLQRVLAQATRNVTIIQKMLKQIDQEYHIEHGEQQRKEEQKTMDASLFAGDESLNIEHIPSGSNNVDADDEASNAASILQSYLAMRAAARSPPEGYGACFEDVGEFDPETSFQNLKKKHQQTNNDPAQKGANHGGSSSNNHSGSQSNVSLFTLLSELQCVLQQRQLNYEYYSPQQLHAET